MIAIQGATYIYPGSTVPALEKIDLAIEPGEFLAITGPNGSGKSTLARLLNGLLRPRQGRVLVDGMDTGDDAALITIRRRVGMVFQDPDNQLVAATVAEDVAFGLENLGLPPAEIEKRVDLALRSVGLEDLAARPPHLLSGGQKQRLALAGVLAMEPRYLVLDEATAMLDPVAREEILEQVLRLRQEQGIAIILITHLMEEAVRADRMLIMKSGRIFWQGSPRELSYQERILAAAGLRLPAVIALAKSLRQGGIKLATNPVCVEELARALWKLASRE
ncbi:energy-coupling factor transporter ATPase [Neomoorella thermoacetica]|uniref:Energy-coupling factor transporter ATP-binding protein EcfA1 n=1 Tax=Neomoorella thermoacetica TaxID=1525 RepID=A0A1J5JLU7_NEOTH|nr:energy-coupling factor transporter ATPase [Moorella thermoacetica]OIQ10093.1 energy-coupling factor transporter ATP-binding protein EcfA1 [Moorella thermoacetica]OIQ54096.1 energy-coupling factor transporter ATP-binding protein EcfA1 [Moorella thermoacetica]